MPWHKSLRRPKEKKDEGECRRRQDEEKFGMYCDGRKSKGSKAGRLSKVNYAFEFLPANRRGQIEPVCCSQFL